VTGTEDFSRDELRRVTRAIQDDHARSLSPLRAALTRLFGDDRVGGDVKADVVLGGLHRRRFLRVGATSVATAAVLAACGTNEHLTAPKAGETTTTVKGAPGDLTVLRTASSLELVAVAVYTAATKSGLVKTAAVVDAVKTFTTHHREHATLFESLTKRLGGQAYATANPVLTQQLQPRVDALKTEQDVLALALDVERAAAATYLGSVGRFTDPTLNEAIMSVGGVEARHAAVLASVLGQPAVPGAFAVTTGAIAPGTGL
jgi:rubrerythrin